jgi:biopolymer transport protein ExbD
LRRRIIQPRGSSIEAINVTPLIDVVMCLIIFFLIVGKLSTDRGVQVRLPESIRGSDETSASVMIVTVARLGDPNSPLAEGAQGWRTYGITVQADGESMSDAKALEAAVRGKLASAPGGGAGLSIQIRADRDLPFGSVEPVLRSCGQAGAKSVRFAAERQEGGRP